MMLSPSGQRRGLGNRSLPKPSAIEPLRRPPQSGIDAGLSAMGRRDRRASLLYGGVGDAVFLDGC